MKKTYFISALVVGCLALFTTSCSEDDGSKTFPENTVRVTSADTELAAGGDTKTITVTGDGITVSLPDSCKWLTAAVSGNNITVTAEPNLGRETRHAPMIIKASNGDHTILSFSQFGAIFTLDAPSEVHINDAAQTIEIASKYNLPITVSSSADWLNVKMEADKMVLTAQANETGYARGAFVYYEIGTVKDSIPVSQWQFEKDLLGSYAYYYYNNGWKGTKITLEKTEAGGYQVVLDSYAAYGWVIPVEYNEQDNTLTIKNLANVGKYVEGETSYDVLVFTMLIAENSLYRSKSPDIAMVGTYTMYDDGTFGWEFDLNNYAKAQGYESAYGVRLVVSTDGTYDGYVGNLLTFPYGYWEKL